MPTYEFRCPDGHEFERFYRKMSDATPEVACPVCGKLAVRLLSGGAGLVFKGSGFYLTDYGKNAHRKAEPSSSESKGAAKGDGKVDSKSEATTTDAKGSDAAGGEKTSAAEKTSGEKATGEKKAAATTPAESKPRDAKSSSSTKSDK